MSYILDALKKAEAERSLGTVPNLHAQPVHAISSGYSTSFFGKPWVWIMLAVLSALIITLAWLRPWKPAPAPAALPALSQPDSRDESELPIADAGAEAPAMPVPRKEKVKKSPKAANASETIPVAAEPVPEPVKKEAPHQKLTLATSIALSPTDEPAAKLGDLPEQIQREIPPLAIGGYIYSSDPGGRSVLINNKLMHEGDQVAANLTLEKMLPHGVILNYKGYRYRAGY